MPHGWEILRGPVPTWRDNAVFELELDLGGLAERLGPQTRFLLRAHSSVARTVEEQPHPQVLDVSAVADVRELLTASDVLVTDYSSVMFDFAITGRPIVLFAYDLEHYRDTLRGMYLDLEREAPGPLLRTPEDLFVALERLGAQNGAVTPDYRHFRDEYAPFDDGNAAARVVEAFFEDGA